MKPRPKPVPSTVTADPVVQGQAGGLKGQSSAQIEHPDRHNHQKPHPKSAFIRKLQQISRDLPNTTPVATPNDRLARFGNAAACDDPRLASDDLLRQMYGVEGWGLTQWWDLWNTLSRSEGLMRFSLRGN